LIRVFFKDSGNFLIYVKKNMNFNSFKFIFHKKFPKGTNRSFKSFLGISEEALNFLYIKYYKKFVFDNRLHILWVFSFLKTYLTLDNLHMLWGVSYNTFRERIWIIMDYLFYNLNEINFDNRLKKNCFIINGKYISAVLDATEVIINNPIDKKLQNEYYSGYYGFTTFKYSVLVQILTGEILYISGPYSGREHDMSMIFKDNFLNNLLENEYVIADKKYRGGSYKILTELDFPPDSRFSFRSKRTIVENANNRIKKFFALKNCFRGNKEQNKKIFFISCHIANIELNFLK
jgi:hypothetical protein